MRFISCIVKSLYGPAVVLFTVKNTKSALSIGAVKELL